MKLMFGKHKGKELSEVPSEYLEWLVSETDVNDPKYGPKNQILVASCESELKRRGDSVAAPGGRGPENPWRKKPQELPIIQLQPKTTIEIITEVKSFIDDLYKKAAAIQRLLDDHTTEGVSTAKSEWHRPV